MRVGADGAVGMAVFSRTNSDAGEVSVPPLALYVMATFHCA